MNRADKRKQKKLAQNASGEKVYKLTDRQLDTIISKALILKRQEMVEKVSNEITNTFMVFCLEVLQSKFGFGKMKLKRFKYFLDELADAVEQEYLDVNDLRNEMDKNIGLEFMYRQIVLTEIYDKKHYGAFEELEPLPPKADKRKIGIT